jgi:hypothetical protein
MVESTARSQARVQARKYARIRSSLSIPRRPGWGSHMNQFMKMLSWRRRPTGSVPKKREQNGRKNEPEQLVNLGRDGGYEEETILGVLR